MSNANDEGMTIEKLRAFGQQIDRVINGGSMDHLDVLEENARLRAENEVLLNEANALRDILKRETGATKPVIDAAVEFVDTWWSWDSYVASDRNLTKASWELRQAVASWRRGETE